LPQAGYHHEPWATAVSANVARVQNEVAAGKQIDQLPIEKTVRVGDDANLQR